MVVDAVNSRQPQTQMQKHNSRKHTRNCSTRVCAFPSSTGCHVGSATFSVANSIVRFSGRQKHRNFQRAHHLRCQPLAYANSTKLMALAFLCRTLARRSLACRREANSQQSRNQRCSRQTILCLRPAAKAQTPCARRCACGQRPLAEPKSQQHRTTKNIFRVILA